MPSEKRERTTTEMKAAALVMEKLSSTSPSLSPCPCLPPSSHEVCRCWFLEDAQHCPVGVLTFHPLPLPTAAHRASHRAGPSTCSAPTRLKSAGRQRITSHLLQWVPRPALHTWRDLGSLGYPCIHPPFSAYRGGAWLARCRTRLKPRRMRPWMDAALHRG